MYEFLKNLDGSAKKIVITRKSWGLLQVIGIVPKEGKQAVKQSEILVTGFLYIDNEKNSEITGKEVNSPNDKIMVDAISNIDALNLRNIQEAVAYEITNGLFKVPLDISGRLKQIS